VEDWMHYDRMLPEVFQRPTAYPYPVRSAPMGWLYEVSDEELRGWTWPELRDQAVSVDTVFEHWKGRFCALWHLAEHEGMTPSVDAEITQAALALRRIQGQRRRISYLQWRRHRDRRRDGPYQRRNRAGEFRHSYELYDQPGLYGHRHRDQWTILRSIHRAQW
jgi:hypothetical protein